MEHPFFPTTTNRADAIQWLSLAEKLLASRDLVNSKSVANRARESDPTLRQPDLILAVVDTLLAAERRIGNNQPDWYSVLRLPPPQPNFNISALLTNQYRNLVLLLNPQVNKYPYADQAFRIVMDAYGVISDPVRKAMYDKELAFYLQQQNRPDPFSSSLPTMQQNFVLFGGAAAANSVAQPHGSGGGSNGGGLSQFVQVEQVQPRVESGGIGSSREQVSFGPNFMFGSGSGSGWVPGVSHKPVQESFQGFGSDNMAHAAEQNIGRLYTDDRQGFLFNDGGRNRHDVNVSENFNFVNVGVNLSERNGNGVNFSEDFSSRNCNGVNVNANVNGTNGVNVSENVGEDEERVDVENVEEDEETADEPIDGEGSDGGESAFWTTCPYCFYMYEYPSKYVDCTIKCQTCKRAFQAVVIPSPPPVADGQEAYFCCWGFFPLGVSKERWEKVQSPSSSWMPFSSMYNSPPMGGARKKSWVYIDDDDDVTLEDSGSDELDDVDWHRGREGKKVKVRTPNKIAKRMRKKGKHVNVQERVVSPDGVSNARRQPVRAARSYGKLDLNVQMSNEAGEPAARMNSENGAVGREHENVEGNGFFEGLDDYLSSIPILNRVGGEDKVGKVA